MRKWFLFFMMAALLALPSLASAQTGLTLTNVNVQLWPEYDQPSMLVIVDYSIPADTSLPIDLKFRIPQDANLIAVANYTADGELLNAPFESPQAEGEWQIFTVALDSTSGHFEYYQPITFNGEQRLFSYLWDDVYAVSAFNLRALEPVDTTSWVTTPKLDSISEEGGSKYYGSAPVQLAANEQYTLNIEYKKTSDTLLVTSPPAVQPATPLDNTTPGRVSFGSILPYLLGGAGLLLVIGGVVYFLQAGKYSGSKKSRRRAHGKSNEEGDGGDVYCAQCGARARGGDRFCRTCGSRIRQNED